MRHARTVWSLTLLSSLLLGPKLAAQGQGGGVVLPPGGYGTLTQNDLALRIRTPDIELRFIPLDYRVARLLARDSWESLRSLVESRHAALDSVAHMQGVTRPGLALVTFFGQRVDARFDPQNLTVVARNRVFLPLGIVPFSGRFTSQQLDVREQVSGLYLFEENLPVNDSFTISYGGITSEDWIGKQRMLDRERARVAARERDAMNAGGDSMPTSDTTGTGR
jgi:hypothetical protein